MNMHLRIKRDSLGFSISAFTKRGVAPLKHRTQQGYNARRYWQNLSDKYGLSLTGAWNEGLSVEDIVLGFVGFEISEPNSFCCNRVLAIRKP